MSFAPIKKRRGRPPKYLSVWRPTVRILPRMDALPNPAVPATPLGTGYGPKVTGQGIDAEDLTKQSNTTTPAQYQISEDLKNNNGPLVKPNEAPVVDGEVVKVGGLAGTREHESSAGTGPTEAEQPVSDSQEKREITDMRSDSENHTMATNASPAPNDSLPHNSPMAAPSGEDGKQIALDTIRNEEGAQSAPVPIEPQTVAPQVPQKRRPGRPPGSTRKLAPKFRGKAFFGDNKELMALQAQAGDDFSLRRFFEAGGRDYNEYLDWLKKKGNEVKMNVAFNQNQGYGQMNGQQYAAFQPGKTAMVPPIPYQAQNGIPFQPRPGYLPIVPTPIMATIANTPNMTMAMPRFTTSTNCTVNPPHANAFYQPPKRTYDNCFPSPPSDSDSGVLDLSAKKARPGDEDFTEIRKYLGEGQEGYTTPPLQNGDGSRDYTRDGELRSPGCHGHVEAMADVDVSSWSVDNVVRFVSSVPGCQDYAELFREHCIDGATLPHLSEDHLLNCVKMKLGPAIKLRLAVQKLTMGS